MSRCRINMLSKSEMGQIHDASLRILQETGAVVRSKEARGLLEGAGAKVVEDEMRVFFPEEVVTQALKDAAREFILGARNPEHDLRVPAGGFPHLCTDGFPVQIRDSDTLERRSSTRDDLGKWARLADNLRTLDFLWPSAGAADMPPHLQLVAGLRTCYQNTEKHIQYQAFSGAEARLEIEMASAVAGGEEENRRRPHFSSVQCIVAPLQYDEGSTDAVIEFARAGIPVVAMTMVTPGITGPATMGGTVSLANAEVLASNAVSQLACRGARVLYCYVCAPLDMRSGNFATGSPEYGMLGVAGTEMARFYGIPSMMGGMGTSAKWPGAQVGFEKAITSIGPAMAGCDLLTGLGGLNDASFVNMEQMLVDAQVWEDVKRLWQGMDVSDLETSLDVIKKVGPRGQFLNTTHTLANFRKLHISTYSDRSGYMAWEKGGKKDIWDIAHEEVRRILSAHKPAPLTSEVDAKLAEIEVRAGRELA